MCNRNSFRRHLRDAGGIGIERKSTVDKGGGMHAGADNSERACTHRWGGRDGVDRLWRVD